MASLEYKELEAQLLESGNKLVEPPSSVDELLSLLDSVESCLSKVEQSPADSMQTALAPSLKALVGEKLLGHSDVDVKVAVASCISEITRITAPEAPYEDDEMKEVFQLIVSSFENMSDESSRSYSKRTSILETVAKVRSCVVMLDLECDALIVEMFQHFLNSIRDHHPENVFSSMETIMALVLEESEDISVELLSPILASVKIDDEKVLPIARKLGEKVLESCATKVKPYLEQAFKTLGVTVDDYSKVVTAICQGADDEDAEKNKVQAPNGNMADDTTVNPELEKEAQEDIEVAEGASVEKVDRSIDGSPQSALSNGITQTAGDDSLADSSSLKKREDDRPTENAEDLDAASNADPDILNPEKEVDTEEKPEQGTEKGEKEAQESPRAENEKEKELPDQQGQTDDGQTDDIPASPREGPSDEAAPKEKDEGSDVKLSPSKTQETAPADPAPASPSENTVDESHSEKTEAQQEKESSDKEAAPPAADIPKKAADVTSDSEAKPSRRTRKKTPAANSSEVETKASSEVDVHMKDSEATSDSEEKPLKQSVKKVGGSKKSAPGSSSKQDEKKKSARGKSVSEKDTKKASAKDIITSPKSSGKSTKDEEKEKETSKTDLKRKRTPAKEKESVVKDFGQSLVGSKIKVWWPDDEMYYDGTIKSFDPVKKQHKVLYTDGEKETLNLKKERWEFIEGGPSESDEEEEAVRSSHVAAEEASPKKKAKTKERTKLKKVEASPKKVGGGSSIKSKAATTVTPKSRGGKSDVKSKDEPPKSVGKSEDHTPKSGSTKPTIISFKSSGKSKNTESQTPSTPAAKSKQVVTPKTGKSKSTTPKTASKDKPSLGGGKSSANGSGKAKSGSSKVKESEDMKEDFSDPEEVPESTKGKSSNQSKSKKRRRGVKG